MKELAADESLSEDARESAKKAFEVLLSSQLLDIEQVAALKKLESEAQFVDKQAQIEVAKLEAEAERINSKTEAQRKKAAAERLQAGVEAGTEDMAEWLARHRLLRYADQVAGIAGPDAVSSDLLFLEEEDVDELGSAMNRVEKRRLQAALDDLREGEAASATRE